MRRSKLTINEFDNVLGPGQSKRDITSCDCKKAKLQARIKLTALCSVIDKENSIEFLLDFLHYIYNYYVAMLFDSYGLYATCQLTFLLYAVTVTCDMTIL